jgi:hypothetical protein
MIKVVLAGLALAAVLAGCGASATSNMDEQHYQDCINAGGSFTDEGHGDGWSCKMPATVTASPTEVPS